MNRDGLSHNLDYTSEILRRQDFIISHGFHPIMGPCVLAALKGKAESSWPDTLRALDEAIFRACRRVTPQGYSAILRLEAHYPVPHIRPKLRVSFTVTPLPFPEPFNQVSFNVRFSLQGRGDPIPINRRLEMASTGKVVELDLLYDDAHRLLPYYGAETLKLRDALLRTCKEALNPYRPNSRPPMICVDATLPRERDSARLEMIIGRSVPWIGGSVLSPLPLYSLMAEARSIYESALEISPDNVIPVDPYGDRLIQKMREGGLRYKCRRIMKVEGKDLRLHICSSPELAPALLIEGNKAWSTEKAVDLANEINHWFKRLHPDIMDKVIPPLAVHKDMASLLSPLTYGGPLELYRRRKRVEEIESVVSSALRLAHLESKRGEFNTLNTYLTCKGPRVGAPMSIIEQLNV
ncbi:MAG: hypothetical protein F7C35_03585 [Desulfurococcales archaeon]|nr:hypothetical protein [Desulfurococcales archaeon]